MTWKSYGVCYLKISHLLWHLEKPQTKHRPQDRGVNVSCQAKHRFLTILMCSCCICCFSFGKPFLCPSRQLWIPKHSLSDCRYSRRYFGEAMWIQFTPFQVEMNTFRKICSLWIYGPIVWLSCLSLEGGLLLMGLKQSNLSFVMLS